MTDVAGTGTASQPHAEVSLADKVAVLRNPATYPGRVSAVEAVETHFAWVFLAGNRAYKLKKPLRLKGVDLRTLEAREHACREELRLNRRLAPDTYLKVAPLTLAGGRLAIGGAGTVLDWLVVMRELRRNDMLDQRLAAGQVAPQDLQRVIEALVGFYRQLRSERFGPREYIEAVGARLEEALRELARPEFDLPVDAVETLAHGLRAAYARNQAALEARAVAGRIVEGHGDLRAEHVWLGPPVRVIDALEFDRSLRLLDTAEEIAMLMVDVAGLGFNREAARLRDAYRRTMPDRLNDELLDFYLALRAATRAKVAIWHLDDGDAFPDPLPWQQRAGRFMTLAQRHAPARG
jgi:aminoglycoside phosphotransferase family enzyme